jgi:hypothetical protein
MPDFVLCQFNQVGLVSDKPQRGKHFTFIYFISPFLISSHLFFDLIITRVQDCLGQTGYH